MGDAAARAIVREAEGTGVGATWARAALDLARLGLNDEAGRAAAMALISDGDPTEALDALAVELDALHVTTLGSPHHLPFMDIPAWSQDSGSVYVSAGHRRLVRWDLREERAGDVWEAPSRITAIAVSPDGESVGVGCTSDRLATVSLVDRNTGSERRIDNGKYAQEIAITRESVLAVNPGLDGAWALPREAGRVSRPLWQVGGPHARLDRSGAFVIGVSRRPGLQRLYDEEGGLVKEFSPPSLDTSAVVVGRRLLFQGQAGHMVLTDLEGKEVAHRDNAPVEPAFVPSPSGRQVAFGSASDTVGIFDLSAGRSRTFTVGFHWRVAWSPSGRTLAVPTKDGRLVLISAP